jgi:hypothetical protein
VLPAGEDVEGDLADGGAARVRSVFRRDGVFPIVAETLLKGRPRRA